MKSLFNLFLMLLFTSVLLSQENVFIEPFVSFKYDAKQLAIDNIYSNSIVEDQTCTFKSKIDSLYFLSISAKNLKYQMSQDEYINLTELDHAAIQKLNNDSISIVNSTEIEINKFKGVVIVADLYRLEKQRLAQYILHRLEDKKLVSIVLQFTLEDYELDEISHARIEDVTSNVLIKSENFTNELEKYFQELYSIEIEKLPLRNLYYYSTDVNGNEIIHKTYDRDSLPTAIEPYPYHHTFRGRVLITPSLKHSVKQIKVKSNNGSYEIFKLSLGDELIFTCKDKQKGLIKRQGKLTVVHEVGKEIEIPFTFEYENN